MCARGGERIRRVVRRGLFGLALLATAGAIGLTGDEARLRVKARLAGLLIDRALAAHLSDGRPHPPWRWADMHPIGELRVPRLDVRRVVLTGASGESMAFGLGHVDGTAAPGAAGNAVIAGHRDTEAAFLDDVEIGDDFLLRTAEGDRAYVVTETAVVSMYDARVIQPSAAEQITLVTCYPFRALRSGPWRYVVVCTAGEAG